MCDDRDVQHDQVVKSCYAYWWIVMFSTLILAQLDGGTENLAFEYPCGIVLLDGCALLSAFPF
jgi:hypothetical protein